MQILNSFSVAKQRVIIIENFDYYNKRSKHGMSCTSSLNLKQVVGPNTSF